MDKRAEILQRLRDLNPTAPIQVYQGTVKSVEGLTCTVNILDTDMVDDAAVPGVSLRANDEVEEGVLIVPRKDSLVFVARVCNSLDDLFVCYVSEVDRIEAVIKKNKVVMDEYGTRGEYEKLAVSFDGSGKTITTTNDTVVLTLTDKMLTADAQGKATLTLDGDGDLAKLEKGTTVIELADKVTIKNSTASLKALMDEVHGIFDELTTLLTTFQVTCTAPGSPSAPFPATTAKVTQLKAKVVQAKTKVGQVLE